jgi:hypothetical protein
LADVIAKSPTGDLTFLVTQYGKPFTAAGFGGWFRERCDEAGLPHCTAHGLRKAGATIAADNGYTARANKRRLAGTAAALIAGTKTEWKVSHPMSHRKVSAENSGT